MTPEEVVSILPMAQTTLSILYQEECNAIGAESTLALCIVDVGLTDMVVDDVVKKVGLRIEPGPMPTIRVSFYWMVNLAAEQRNEELVHALRRAVLMLPRFRRTLSVPASRAAVYLQKAKLLRLTDPEHFSLPERHFTTALSFTMTCPLTGESEVVSATTPQKLQSELISARHRLSARVYQHEQVADLLDTIEAQRLAVDGPPAEPESVVVTTAPNELRLEFEYEQSEIAPEYTEP